MNSLRQINHFVKILLIGLVFMLSTSHSFAQNSINETEKITTFCKVWGFLKYYHPEVAKGKLDWDKEFTPRISSLHSLQSKKEISDFYSAWINSLGKVDECKKCDNEIADRLKLNLDLTWLSDTNLFSPGLVSTLQYIQRNRNQRNYFYVQRGRYNTPSFRNEKQYKDSVFPSPNFRLLSLSRYWNIINYFYPDKYLTDENWNNVLNEMIPKFRDAKDTIAYHLAMLELTVKIDDSHGIFVTKYTNQYFGFKWAPFIFKLIDNKAIVTGFYDSSFCNKDDIRYGDVILKVNDIPIQNITKEKSKYIEGSNEAAKLRNFSYAIFNGSTDSVKITYERNNEIMEKEIHRYYFRDFKYTKADGKNQPVYKILEGNIGYLNLANLKKKDVKNATDQLKNTRALIIDVRNYPKFGLYYKLANFLNDRKKPFAKFSNVDYKYPGVFKFTGMINCGRSNKNYYKGKVVLLFNEMTQSRAEYTVMALKTAPDVTGIGRQTAGADGDIATVIFPGGYYTFFSGAGIYYPDGRTAQRIGIIPDIEVKPTIEGIRLKKDEVLEKAIEYLNK